jgi:DNA-binding NtrC family response regulator
VTAPPARVLIVDDDPLVRDMLAELLEGMGHEVDGADSTAAAWQRLQDAPPELILLDLRLGEESGLKLLEELAGQQEAGVVMMTAHGSVGTAVEAMKLGAVDFVSKPFRAEEMERAVHQALRVTRLRRENRQLRRQIHEWQKSRTMVGRSRAMQNVHDLVSTVAPSRSNVLIAGESGTGKELVAQALHRLSPRASRPFVKINCAAVPTGLLESELFGHEKGAFTGAHARGSGKFELADGGTLLLDEISEMDPSLQPKLLRALQEREFYRIGGTEPVRVDVRILATTNADLGRRVREGTFREDLFYRLNVVPVEVPPLRARKEDIPELAHHFAEAAAAENGRAAPRISQAVLERLNAYDWPGNVRELENIVSRGVILCHGPQLEVRHLLWSEGPVDERNASASSDNLKEQERRTILRILEEEDGNRTRAARRLGISVRTVRNKLAEYGAGSRPEDRPARRRALESPLIRF